MLPWEKLERSVPRREGDYVTVLEERLHLWASSRRKHFPDKRVEIYIDKENKLLGLKPVKEGGMAISVGGIRCKSLSPYKIKLGRYPVRWSDKHKMLIAEIELEE